MASLDEIAHTISDVLQSPFAPNPLPLDMMNHSPEQAGYLVRTVIEASADAGVALEKAEISSWFGASMSRGDASDVFYHLGVPIVIRPALSKHVLFFVRREAKDGHGSGQSA